MGLQIIVSNGQSCELTGEITVGREAGCTVVLSNDQGVSRRHARFLWIHGLPMVEDLGSSNGTFLNGARVTQARPVSSGDEITIGSATLRVEAVLDSTPPGTSTQAATSGSREVSRSERRQKGGRKHESSGIAEGSLYGNHGAGDPLRGCALPNIDLSGCMKYLWILLLVLLAAIVIGLILFAVGALVSAVGGAGSSMSGAGGSSSGSAGSGAGQSPAGNTPPQSQDQPPPQQPQDQKQGQAPSAEGIHIEQVRVDFAKRGIDQARPVVLIKWLNLTKKPVQRLSGTVYVYDRDGKLLLEIPRERLYDGAPVNPGEGTQDTLEKGGVVLLQKLNGVPATATVKVERIE